SWSEPLGVPGRGARRRGPGDPASRGPRRGGRPPSVAGGVAVRTRVRPDRRGIGPDRHGGVGPPSPAPPAGGVRGRAGPNTGRAVGRPLPAGLILEGPGAARGRVLATPAGGL